MQEITIIGANSYLARNLIYFLRDKNLYLYGHREKQADGQHKNVETTHLEVFVDAFGYRTWFPNKKDD